MRRLPRLAALAAAAWAMAAAPVHAAEIRSISDKIDDDIVSITTEGGRSVLKTAKGRTIALEIVKHIRFDERAPSLAADANVILLNKDEIHGSVGVWDGKSAFKLQSALGPVNVDLDKVAAVFFNVPPESERRLQSKYLGWLYAAGFAGRPGPDAVYIRAGGKANGTINEISSKGIILDATGIGMQTFAIKDVEAIVAGNAGAGTAPAKDSKGTLVRIRCADGSSLSGTIESLVDGKITLTHTLGTITINVSNVLELFVLNGAFVYVSDLDPTKVVEEFPPGFPREDIYGWKRDKENLDGGRLRLGNRSYDKGLGVHSFCSLEYDIAGGFKEFRTVIGLDDSTKYLGYQQDASVTFRVLLDGKPAKELPEGKKKKRGETPEELAIDVEGVKTLTLVADYGNFMHILGRADWADAHLVKKR
jgi:hypothetical protein